MIDNDDWSIPAEARKLFGEQVWRAQKARH
jgi:hypothetical protein